MHRDTTPCRSPARARAPPLRPGPPALVGEPVPACRAHGGAGRPTGAFLVAVPGRPRVPPSSAAARQPGTPPLPRRRVPLRGRGDLEQPGPSARVVLDRTPGQARPPEPLWLWYAGPAPPDRARVRTPAQMDTWTWLIIAAHAKLRLARAVVADRRLPWERPLAPGGRQQPACRVRCAFPALLCALGSPASAPKPVGHPPGRPPRAADRAQLGASPHRRRLPERPDLLQCRAALVTPRPSHQYMSVLVSMRTRPVGGANRRQDR